ncbi:polysaccharide deacetylase family protein [Paenibacillus sp. CAU 1782]
MRRIVQIAVCVVLLWFGVLEYNTVLTGSIGSAENAVLAVGAKMDGFAYRERPISPDYAVEASTLTTMGLQRGQVVSTAKERNIEADTSAAIESDFKNRAASQAEDQPLPSKVVYLTFDDGPSKYTPGVLDILKKEDIKATFFVLGEHVERNPEIARAIVEEGHSIGNHTFNHVYKQLYGSFGGFSSQIMKADDAIYEATGIRTNLVRAPGGTYGNFDQSYFDAMKAAGYIVHDWNVDSGDSRRRGVPAYEIVENVKRSKLADTLNVLLHDSSGHGELLQALPQIISYYKGLGYTFLPIDHETKPMQFSVAPKSKWSRGAANKLDREKLIAYAESRTGKMATSINNEVNGFASQPSLYIHYGNNTLELDSEHYQLKDGSIQVPLKQLMEWLGGRYDEDRSSGIIEASLHGKELFWSGQSQGERSAPIRATLALFDLKINDYYMGKDRRDIWISG